MIMKPWTIPSAQSNRSWHKAVIQETTQFFVLSIVNPEKKQLPYQRDLLVHVYKADDLVVHFPQADGSWIQHMLRNNFKNM